MLYREEVSLLERNKYKFSPLELLEELPALFHGEALASSGSTSSGRTIKLSCAANRAAIDKRAGLKK